MKSTLTNEQLIAKAKQWVKELCESGGRKWSLRVPVDFNHDPDVIFTELCNRLEEYAQQSQPSGMRWVRASERLPEDGVGMLKYVWVRNIQTKAGCMQPLADYKKIDGIENTEWLDEPSPAGAAEGANDVDYLG